MSGEWQRFCGDRRGVGYAFFFEAIAVAADVDNGGAMQQPIQGCRSHDAVSSEDLSPVGEGPPLLLSL